MTMVAGAAVDSAGCLVRLMLCMNRSVELAMDYCQSSDEEEKLAKQSTLSRYTHSAPSSTTPMIPQTARVPTRAVLAMAVESAGFDMVMGQECEEMINYVVVVCFALLAIWM